MLDKLAPPKCHSGHDGDCDWKECPQLKDKEPEKSGRHCPYDIWWAAYYESVGEEYGR